MNKLRALLAAMGVVVIGGIAYQLATPRAGVTRADFLDAGITQECDPVNVSCQVRNGCYPALPRYGTISKLAFQCNRDGGQPPVLIIPWPKNDAGTPCFVPVGQPELACLITGASFDDGGNLADTQLDQDRCACRPSDAGICRYQTPDGSTPLMVIGNTYPPPFAGAGCVRKACDEVDGEQGQSMPAACQ